MKKHLLLLGMSLLGFSAAVAQTPTSGLFAPFTTSTETEAEADDVRSRATEKSVKINYYQASTTSATAFNEGVIPAGADIYIATEIHADDIIDYAGAQIASITCYGGKKGLKNPISDFTVFITDDLNGTPLYTQTSTFPTKMYASKTVELETPFTIPSEGPLYVGYYFTNPAYNDEGKFDDGVTYIPVDGIPAEAGNTIMGYSQEAGTLPSKWDYYGTQVGSARIVLALTGDALPSNLLRITASAFPHSTNLGETASYQILVLNKGCETVSSFDVMTECEGEEPVTRTIERSIGKAKTAVVDIPDIICNSTGGKKVTATIVKVNGETPKRESSISGGVVLFTEGYDRTLVVEEATGTWCGWCPRGIAALEYIKENYSEGIIGIAYHDGDEMTDRDYSYGDFLSQFVAGYPFLMLNRAETIEWASEASIKSGVKQMYDTYATAPSYGAISVEAGVDGNDIVATATVKFSVDISFKHNVSFVLVEDNVGPYQQTNNYAGGSTAVFGWENKSSYVRTIFNDVVRHMEGYPGVSGDLPESLAAETEYTYQATLPLNKVVKPNNGNYYVVALLINNSSSQIVNAAKVEAAEVSAVEDIVVEENNAPAEYYNLQGIRVANPENGLYILRQGSKTSKVYIE